MAHATLWPLELFHIWKGGEQVTLKRKFLKVEYGQPYLSLLIKKLLIKKGYREKKASFGNFYNGEENLDWQTSGEWRGNSGSIITSQIIAKFPNEGNCNFQYATPTLLTVKPYCV